MSVNHNGTNRGDRDNGTPQREPAVRGWRRFFALVGRYWRLVFTLLLFFVIACMYQWKIFAVERVKEKLQEQQRLCDRKAGDLLAGKNRSLMRLSAIPLAWAVKSDMAGNNYGNIEKYFNFMVRQDRFRVILLVKSDGTVIVSTDKRMEGFPVGRFYPASVLRQAEPEVSSLPDGSMMVVAPVSGVAGKLGVLIMVFEPEIVSLSAAGG